MVTTLEREQWRGMLRRSFSPLDYFVSDDKPGSCGAIGDDQGAVSEERMMYVYRQSVLRDGVYLVGFFDPKTRDFQVESECPDAGSAAKRVHWLNGGPEN